MTFISAFNVLGPEMIGPSSSHTAGACSIALLAQQMADSPVTVSYTHLDVYKRQIVAASDESNDILNCKIAEYTKAVVDGRPAFYINLVIDVSPYCDCHAENDAAIVPDVGFFASFDPVALDIACADAVNAQPVISNTCLSEADHEGHDHFGAMFPTTDWRTCIEHAKKIGLGTDEYELVVVK